MILLFWLALATVVGAWAHNHRNRNGFGWFVIALLISPLLAWLLLLALKPVATVETPVVERAAVIAQLKRQKEYERREHRRMLGVMAGVLVASAAISAVVHLVAH